MSDSTKSEIRSLGFDDLKLETIVIELRYKFAFLFWDVSGELWQEIEEKLPGEFSVGKASPASVSVVYADMYDIVIEQQRFALSSSHPKASLSEFLDILKIVFDTLTNKLKIEVINRIGFRQIFTREYSSMKKVVEALRSLPSIVIPEKILSNHEKDYIIPSFTLRVEGDTKGTFFNLRGGTRDFEITIPAYIKEKADIQEVFEQSLLSFDIDFYTKIDVPIGQLSIVDWVRQAHETVKKDASNFF